MGRQGNLGFVQNTWWLDEPFPDTPVPPSTNLREMAELLLKSADKQDVREAARRRGAAGLRPCEIWRADKSVLLTRNVGGCWTVFSEFPYDKPTLKEAEALVKALKWCAIVNGEAPDGSPEH